jgi:four helix bundle protein
MGAKRFEELIAWQLADALRSEVIAFTESGQVAKDFKYRDQIRDAIGSACRNTSEGFGRFKPRSFCQFLEYARASLNETQDCLLVAQNKRSPERTTRTGNLAGC